MRRLECHGGAGCGGDSRETELGDEDKGTRVVSDEADCCVDPSEQSSLESLDWT